ncbi:DEAD/DEAH box helicase [Corynebacterium pelargi]|uniref:ATP-dependent RNA helicase RhlE n=1 Tax=Corynebacterium pelargi TaxID=1471400 RepID=A0A410W8Z1_9CORY|nr:DEAD/DEAH box helicase [Corynebacterium pelargi]QAU52417.1 ATP-dependent RNA helicase RhlE [Corynebacterium pelargi]GGG67830.1 helicase [Corynebacterium pelargi]
MTSFQSLGLPVAIVHELQRQGITSPFPIQAAAIPSALEGKDVLGRGPTGSGKTFTFGLPMLARLQGGASKPKQPRALVLVPTRELALQVSQRLAPFAAVMGMRVLEVFGGVNINRNLTALAAPVDMLVATPGRLQDLLDRKAISLESVLITALDEADQMADMGFMPQVRKLLDATPAHSQRLLFSATLDGDVNTLVKRYMHSPVTHSTAGVQQAVDTMTHYRFDLDSKEQRNELVQLIAGREGKTIMFMRTKHTVDRQVKKLRRRGIHAAGLHGDKGQGSRTRAVEAFQSGEIPVLVATDIAARGIDISEVDLVVHIDPPVEHKAYLHRAGRTARAGTNGAVLTLVLPEQRSDVDAMLAKAKVDAKMLEDASALIALCGAKETHGAPLPPFGAQQPKAATQKAKGASRGRSGVKKSTGSRRRSTDQGQGSRSAGRRTGSLKGKQSQGAQRGSRDAAGKQQGSQRKRRQSRSTTQGFRPR